MTSRPGPEGTRFSDIQAFEVIDSTNRYLMEEGKAGAKSGLVAVAKNQSEGRGRRGRVWDSKPGSSLLFSVLFRDGVEALTHVHGQAMGLAVVDACREVANVEAKLKWPNDVLINERKLAGVLVEASTTGSETIVVVGCGININWGNDLPQTLRETAVSLDEPAGHPIDDVEMLNQVLRALDKRLNDVANLTNEYRKHCDTLGRQVRITQPGNEITGTAVDVTNEGALIVDNGAGVLEVVTIGDVVSLRATL